MQASEQTSTAYRHGGDWRSARVRRLAIGAALIGALMLPGGGVSADPLEDAPDVQFLRNILQGIGLKRDGETINYRERSPLVVPPDASLPPPQTATPAQLNPAWPVDQNIQHARAEEAAVRQRLSESDRERGRALRPNELDVRRRSGTNNPVGLTPEESAKPLLPSALGMTSNLFGKIFDRGTPETKPFTGEPPRTALTEPPPGYQTPSPNQPYGVNSKDSLIEDEKPMNPMDLPARGN